MHPVPTDDLLDHDHGGHGAEDDGPSEEEVGAGEGVQRGAVHQGVQRPGEEWGESRNQ